MNESFQLIVISPEQDLPDEANQVIQLFENGMRLYHLRKPSWTSSLAEQFLQAIPKLYRSHIVIHSHFELVGIYVLKGIHLNERNRENATLFEKYKVVSASFHSFGDLLKEKFPYEYVFLSPVFDSISKPGYRAGFHLPDLEVNLHRWMEEKDRMKIIALGGIHAANISAARQLGFSGAAVIGSLWNTKNPIESFLSLQTALQTGS